ncbi:MAG: hypothetical protein PUC26_07380 [Eubacteriales bacterium]|nr:hypothetical protein [Eubacteriales bacterium]
MKKNKMTRGRRLGVCGLAACVALAMGFGFFGSEPGTVEAKDATQKKIEKTYPELVKSSEDSHTLSKDETAYEIMDADGNTKEIQVSEWLKNGTNAGTIKDVSELKDIENTSGNEKFDQNGEQLTWHAGGRDIHYSGTTENPLPVKVKVSYYLDGKKVSAKEIKGKSGAVEIHFDYEVSKKDTVSGRTITHPYTMASGVLLDGSKFTNVSVEGGRNVNDGSTNVALGVAFPGLSEDLGLSGKLNIPDSVVVKADTTDFTIDGTYTIAMSGLLGDINASGADSLKAKVNALESGLTQLASSSAKLVKATKQVKNGAAKLSSGSKRLESGGVRLKAGTSSLVSGSGKIVKGADSLAAGNAKLVQGSKSLKSGTAAAQDGINSLNANLNKLTSKNAALNTATKQLVDSIFATTSSQLKASGLDLGNLTTENYASVLDKQIAVYQKQIAAYENVDTDAARAAVQAMRTAVGSLQSAKTTLGQVVAYEDSVKQYTDATQAIYGATSTELASGASQLDQGAAQLASGLQAENQGIASLSQGLTTLYKGSKSLNKGVGTLNNGISSLATGARTLSSGTSQLAAGMEKFDKAGIQKLVSSLDDAALKKAAGNFEAVVKASRNKVFVGGKAASMEGTSKIIFKTAEVK